MQMQLWHPRLQCHAWLVGEVLAALQWGWQQLQWKRGCDADGLLVLLRLLVLWPPPQLQSPPSLNQVQVPALPQASCRRASCALCRGGVLLPLVAARLLQLARQIVAAAIQPLQVLARPGWRLVDLAACVQRRA
jgi:hypothetical protein